jgi:hypothetical protein
LCSLVDFNTLGRVTPIGTGGQVPRVGVPDALPGDLQRYRGTGNAPELTWRLVCLSPSSTSILDDPFYLILHQRKGTTVACPWCVERTYRFIHSGHS